MNSISNNDIARAIYLASKDKDGSELKTVMQNVLRFLSRHRLLPKSNEILFNLRNIINQTNEILEVKVWSKDKIEDETKNDLIRVLKKRYKDKEILLLENFDEKLLGGIKIEVNNELIDLTLRNKINKLEEYLTSDHE